MRVCTVSLARLEFFFADALIEAGVCGCRAFTSMFTKQKPKNSQGRPVSALIDPFSSGRCCRFALCLSRLDLDFVSRSGLGRLLVPDFGGIYWVSAFVGLHLSSVVEVVPRCAFSSSSSCLRDRISSDFLLI